MGWLRSSWTERVIMGTGVAVSALGAAVLTGWYIHSTLLIQVLPTAAPMQRMTALGLLVSGVSLALAGTGRNRMAAACALFVFLQGILVCLEYILSAQLGIDQLLGRDYVLMHVSNAGRMSPLSAVCFLGVSLALLATASPRLGRLASTIVGILASVLLAVAIVALLGYILGNTQAYGWSHFKRIAPHTAAGFSLLGTGLLGWAWRKGRTNRGTPEWLPLSVGLGLAAGAVGVWQALLTHEGGHPATLSGVILAGGIVGALLVAIAVAQTQRAQKHSRELQASSAMLHQLFEGAPDGLIMVDRQGTILRVNRQAETMFGYGPSELLGAAMENLVPVAFRERHRMHQESYFAAPHVRPMCHGLDLHARRKNGSEFPVEIALTPLQSSNNEPVVVAVVHDITARRQALEALRLSEERFRSTFEQSPIGVTLVDSDRRMIAANPALCRMLGYAPEELARMTPLEITYPDDRVPTTKLIEQLFTGEVPVYKLEKRYVKKNGEMIWGSLSAALIRDGNGRPHYAVGMVEDITQRKHAEEELRSLSKRLSLATRTASIGIWDLDLRTRRAVWDDTLFEIFGMPRVPSLAYEEFARRVHPDDLAAVEASVQRVIQGKTQDFVEFRIIRPDGAVRHVSAAEGVVFDDEGNVIRLVGTSVDITERKAMEAQIEASKEQLVASERLSALGMMAGGVAHEINNPLFIIHASAADLLRVIRDKGTVPPEIAVRYGERILQTANRIIKIIKSMRQLTREGSRDRVSTTPVSRIVEETLEVCKERFKDHSVNLLLPSIDAGLSVDCREVQIGQVLLNLLQNAFDAVAEQPTHKWVRFDVAVDAETVEFSVTDSGPGIAPELKGRIMEPFFTTKEVGKGTGLGLSLSRKIVEEHGGKLEVTERAGHPCFSFRLPLSRKQELVCS
jgi:PAS domain S-box-containing protein